MSANPRELAVALEQSLVDIVHLCSVDMETWNTHSNLVLKAISALLEPGSDAGAVTSLPGEEWIAALFKHHHRSACYPECSDEEAHTFARAVLARLSPNRVDDKIEASAGSKVTDWVAVAKSAGKHGVRYRTNAALEAFLSEVSGALVHGETAPDPVAADGIVERLKDAKRKAEARWNGGVVLGRGDISEAIDLIVSLQAQLASAKAAGRREGLMEAAKLVEEERKLPNTAAAIRSLAETDNG